MTEPKSQKKGKTRKGTSANVSGAKQASAKSDLDTGATFQSQPAAGGHRGMPTSVTFEEDNNYVSMEMTGTISDPSHSDQDEGEVVTSEQSSENDASN